MYILDLVVHILNLEPKAGLLAVIGPELPKAVAWRAAGLPGPLPVQHPEEARRQDLQALPKAQLLPAEKALREPFHASAWRFTWFFMCFPCLFHCFSWIFKDFGGCLRVFGSMQAISHEIPIAGFNRNASCCRLLSALSFLLGSGSWRQNLGAI